MTDRIATESDKGGLTTHHTRVESKLTRRALILSSRLGGNRGERTLQAWRRMTIMFVAAVRHTPGTLHDSRARRLMLRSRMDRRRHAHRVLLLLLRRVRHHRSHEVVWLLGLRSGIGRHGSLGSGRSVVGICGKTLWTSRSERWHARCSHIGPASGMSWMCGLRSVMIALVRWNVRPVARRTILGLRQRLRSSRVRLLVLLQ